MPKGEKQTKQVTKNLSSHLTSGAGGIYGLTKEIVVRGQKKQASESPLGGVLDPKDIHKNQREYQMVVRQHGTIRQANQIFKQPSNDVSTQMLDPSISPYPKQMTSMQGL